MRLLNISVLGCGRWGTFIAWYANKIGHNVMLWGRENSRNYIELNETRKNDYLKLSEDIELSNSLHKAISFAEIMRQRCSHYIVIIENSEKRLS